MPADEAAAKPADAYHHGDLRQALLSAAVAKVDRDGADTLSLAAIARALGVSQAAPYRHFPDREALLAAVATEGFRMFSKALHDAAAAQSDSPPLSRMAHAYVAFGLARPGLYRLMFASHILSRAAQGDELKTAAQASFALLVEAVDPSAVPGQREGRALKIWVGLHGLVMLTAYVLLADQPAAFTLDQLIADILA